MNVYALMNSEKAVVLRELQELREEKFKNELKEAVKFSELKEYGSLGSCKLHLLEALKICDKIIKTDMENEIA